VRYVYLFYIFVFENKEVINRRPL